MAADAGDVVATEVDLDEVRRRARRAPRVTVLVDAFERIASGQSQVPLREATAAASFLERDPEYRRHDEIFRSCLGTFYRHGCASIPFEIEEFARVDRALLRLARDRGADQASPLTYWETSSADGTRGRTLAEYAAGRIVTLTDSPSEANRREFAGSRPHPHAHFYCGSWVDITPRFLQTQTFHEAFRAGFDVIWENTTFQMYGPNRSEQLACLRQVLKPDGLVVFFEKMNHPDPERYRDAELVKDREYKARFFHPDDVNRKREEILAVMETGQVTLDDFVLAAGRHFTCGALIWNSTNFYEVVGCDEDSVLNQFLGLLDPPFVPPGFAFEASMVRRLW